MQDNQLHRPGDRVFRPRRIKRYRLRRVLGVAALFSAGYGNVGSSIYYALGIVALVALGATPIALGIAGMMGFIAGWALMLSYIVTISISAFTIPPYLGFFWEPLKSSPEIGTAVAMGIVFMLMIINVVGVKETSALNLGAAVIDILTQVSLVVIGFILLFDPVVVWDRMVSNWPSTENLILGIALASIAYTGIETMSQMAEETRQPEKKVPRALFMMIVTVLVIFAGISLVSFSAMTPQELAGEWSRDPVAGIAANLGIPILMMILKPLIGILAGTILLIAANAGLIGISRLAFSLGSHKLIPKTFSKIHPKFKTPYISIVIFGIIAILLLVPGFFAADVFTNIGSLYAFGSLLAFIIAHSSIISLRIRKPDLPRPFKLALNIKIKGREIPVSAVIGILATSIIWVIILATQPFSRWVGFAWMIIGIIIFILYRRRRQS